jgi:hypothetical protein
MSNKEGTQQVRLKGEQENGERHHLFATAQHISWSAASLGSSTFLERTGSFRQVHAPDTTHCQLPQSAAMHW